MSLSPRIAEFPVKFPDTREFAWRQVRSALRRQPGSPVLGVIVPDTCRRARQWRAFAIRCPVSGLPNSENARLIYRKSPDTTGKTPVFRRPTAETGFDQHWLAERAVQFAK